MTFFSIEKQTQIIKKSDLPPSPCCVSLFSIITEEGKTEGRKEGRKAGRKAERGEGGKGGKEGRKNDREG
jgi:hypothetical protein